MKHVFLLSKDNLKLAKAEAEALVGENCSADKNILFVKKEIDAKQLGKRLAYTKTILQELFSCSYGDLEKNLEKFEWQEIYDKSFVVRKNGYNENKIRDEKEYGKYVWRNIRNPKVDLKEANTKIIILCGRKVHVCLFVSETDKSYSLRKAHLRPSLHPTSLNPKLAKAMINLTGAEKGSLIADPFCGSGGILIEAGLMQMKTIGVDISKKLLKMAEKNMEHYKIRNFKLIEGDAVKARIKADYVVTDLPYGIGSRITGKNEELYDDFLKNMKTWGVKKSVIGFPSFVDFRKIIKKAGFKIENEFEEYLHRNLAKKIVVLS